MLRYTEAREKVISVVSAHRRALGMETAALDASCSRVLAEEVRADRDYPPFDRSTRDGFAVRAADTQHSPATLTRVGEVKAGSSFTGKLAPGECVQIMTGAPLPAGADAVVMIEFTGAERDRITVNRSVRPRENVVRRGSETTQGEVLLRAGTRIGFAEIALMAQVGKTEVGVWQRPRVAILSTGDEVVEIDRQPGPFEIRNSNSRSLLAQVHRAGGEGVLLGNAPDAHDILREAIRRGLEEDILVLSGGVSMGKYDLVEDVLRGEGSEFYFDAVAIRPGRPAVFGKCGDVWVFGLPGNPVSTMVTFELLVRPAVELLSGMTPRPLLFLRARLTEEVNHKPGLTFFLPALVESLPEGPSVRVLPWQGSGDIVALARANCFIVVPEEAGNVAAGCWVDVWLRDL